MKKIIKSACKRLYFYDNDDIQILFKTKNPWGVNDLLWGVNWGVLGGLQNFLENLFDVNRVHSKV